MKHFLRKVKGLSQYPGFRTDKKIVVIESDDWGAIRTKDRKTLIELERINPLVAKDRISQFDSLETIQDLDALFSVLQSVKDKNGRNAVITANTIVANPDYELIKSSRFKVYFPESITKSYEKHSGNDVLGCIKQGINQNIYLPQLHGREHLNVAIWMRALEERNKEVLRAFELENYGIPFSSRLSKRKNVMSAFDYYDSQELFRHKAIIEDAVKRFEDIFTFRPSSFISTTYVWDKYHEEVLNNCGVKFIQGIPFQFVPKPKKAEFDKRFHYTGQKNSFGQYYVVRNVIFEPYTQNSLNLVNECLKRIEIAFNWKKPAIISSHRVNFMGTIDENNRKQNLIMLKKLLQKIIEKWPDVEFMSSDKLGEYVSKQAE
jgi:hypothetical protein